jgi:hypothetical protein
VIISNISADSSKATKAKYTITHTATKVTNIIKVTGKEIAGMTQKRLVSHIWSDTKHGGRMMMSMDDWNWIGEGVEEDQK